MSATAIGTMNIARHSRRHGRRPGRDAYVAPAIWALVLAATIVGIGTLPTTLDRIPPRAVSSMTTAVRVRPSDTLWSIAEANRAPGRSTAQTVDDIRRLNGLATAQVGVGSLLRVPVDEVADDAYAEAAHGDPVH